MQNRRLWWFLVLLIAAWLLWMTLRTETTVSGDLAPVIESQAAEVLGTHLLISILGNIVVFVPLGAALAMALGGRDSIQQIARATVVGAGFSAFIELLQLALPSRWTDLADWVLNTVGVALGAVAVTYLTRIRR